MHFSLSKSLLLLLFVAVLITGCSEQQGGQSQFSAGAVKGEPAPDFTLTDMQGQKVTLSDLKGKVVILNFWATWCPPCREEMPSMEQLYRRYGGQGLVILAVNVEENGMSAVKRFLQRTPYSFPILLDADAEVQNTYKVFRFPETFIIDRNGNIVEKVIGAIDWTAGPTFKLINFLLNG
jgi:peroxiredoxin